jgi:hypothetical protein
MTIPRFVIYTAAVIAVIGVGVGAVFLWYSSMQISTAKANQICADFSNQVRSDIAKLSGYTVLDDSKSCEPIEDELSFTDYKLRVTFTVAKDGLDTEAAITDSMKNISDTLPQREYPINVYNLPAGDTQTQMLCVSAFRYLDNDGQDVPQGPPDHKYQYVAKDVAADSPCL